MLKFSELSLFQKNMNYLTFYLFLMNTKCKYLEDYDDEGPFISHNDFFQKCREKLKFKIQDDDNLLINQPLFQNYFAKNINENSKCDIENMDLTNNEEKKIYETYFEYSKTLSKSKIRNKCSHQISWGATELFFWLSSIGFIILSHFAILLKAGIDLTSSFMILYFFIACRVIVSSCKLVHGLILKSELKNTQVTKRKFDYLYSDDYCYKRIKECEFFFRTHYNVEDEILEISETERKFPKTDNFFYKTIMEVDFEGPDAEINRDTLLAINDNIYCRAVFSELFNLVKEEGIDELQQIPFVFKACKLNAKVEKIKGNKPFSECINHLCKGEFKYSPESFNQALPKLKNPEDEIRPKYLALLKKYENILQDINISSN